MMKRVVSQTVQNNYINPDIEVFDELDIGGKKIQPGSRFQLKRDKTMFLFLAHAVNNKTGTSWVDVVAESDGGFKSVKIDDIILPKEKRRVKRLKKD